MDKETNNWVDKFYESFDILGENSGLDKVFQEKLKELKNKTPEDYKLKINFVNHSNNEDPKFQKDGDSGFDLRANLDSTIVIEPNESQIIPTGLHFQLSDGYELQVRPRSGLAAKHSITVLNTPGTVDSHYIGEVKIILINHGKESFKVEHGDRIAQGVICPVMTNKFIRLTKTDELDETERGDSGFGSTGIK